MPKLYNCSTGTNRVHINYKQTSKSREKSWLEKIIQYKVGKIEVLLHLCINFIHICFKIVDVEGTNNPKQLLPNRWIDLYMMRRTRSYRALSFTTAYRTTPMTQGFRWYYCSSRWRRTWQRCFRTRNYTTGASRKSSCITAGHWKATTKYKIKKNRYKMLWIHLNNILIYFAYYVLQFKLSKRPGLHRIRCFYFLQFSK